MKYSKNKRAGKVVGLRPTGGTAFDFPCELGYHCPVCDYKLIDGNGNYDERLDWSEYNGFIWCSKCNKDFPSFMCMPDLNNAIDLFLDFIEYRDQNLEQLVESLIDMVNQHCTTDRKGNLDSMGLSTNADALHILAEYGKIDIINEFGRSIKAKWRKNK